VAGGKKKAHSAECGANVYIYMYVYICMSIYICIYMCVIMRNVVRMTEKER
jgi:hypothetical protein